MQAAGIDTATRPCQVWSWDITWLPTAIAGSFYTLFMVIDLYSPKFVAWKVHTTENGELASELIRKVCLRENNTAPGLVLYLR